MSGLTQNNNLNKDKLDKDTFVEYLNEILSAENAGSRKTKQKDTRNSI
jgi:hypothetical protein